jgi:hypothetical protein
MSEVKVDTISERTAAGGVTIDGVLIKDGVATFQTPAGSPLVFEGATANAFETTFAITDPTADRTITFPDSSFTVPTTGGMVLQVKVTSSNSTISTSSTSYVTTGLSITTDAPASTSSRFILTLAGGTTYSDYAAGEVWTTFYVGGSEVSDAGPYSMIQENDRYHITMVPNNFFTNSAMMIHSPASTSAQTYAVFFKANANGAYFNLASSRVVFTVMELSS